MKILFAGMIIVSCLLVVAPAYAASVYDDAVDYWNFDEGSGQIAYDDGDDEKDVSLNYYGQGEESTMWTSEGKINGGIAYGGVHEEAINNTSSLSAPRESVSISAWVNYTQTGDNRTIYRSYYSLQPTNYLVELYIDASGRINLYRQCNDVRGRTKTSDSAIETGEWTHIVATYENNQSINGDWRIYINGELDAQDNSWYYTIEQDMNYTNVGRYVIDGRAAFWGTMDELAVWDRELTADEVDTLYNTGFVMSGITELELGYSSDELNQLSSLYEAQTGELVIDDITWTYLAGTLPGDTGYDIGDAWEYEDVYYVKMGSGLKGENNALPEPATVLALITGLGIATLRKTFKRK